MSIARTFFEWQRDFRHFRWYYNSRRINIENGRNSVEQFLALSQHIDVVPAPTDAGDAECEAKLAGAMPADLNEIRQAYESKSIEYVERFRSLSAKVFRKMETISEQGITNISLMRHDLFSYLRTYALILRYKVLVWILFVLGLMVLTTLDVAPTLLVFEGLMEGDTVSIGHLRRR